MLCINNKTFALESAQLPTKYANASITSTFSWLKEVDQPDIFAINQLPPSSWTNNLDAHVNFGPSTNAYWFKLHIENISSENAQRYLEINRPYLDIIDIYIFQKDKLFKRYKLGDHRPLSNRPIRSKEFVIPLKIEQKNKLVIYIYAKGNGSSFNFFSQLWAIDDYIDHKFNSDFFIAFYFGAIIILGFYNLFVYFSTKEAAYAFYSLYVFSFVTVVANISGISQLYIFPESPKINAISFYITAALYRASIYLFTIKFLNTKKNLPRFHIVLTGLAAIELLSLFFITLPSWLFSFDLTLSYLQMFLLRTTPLPVFICLFTGLYLLYRGRQEARFFCMAWCVLALSFVLNALVINNVIRYSSAIYQFSLLLQLLEMLLLSFALADRLNIHKSRQAALLALEQKTKKAREEALISSQENIASKAAFLLAISHELRTPMNAIIGGLQLSKNDHHLHQSKPFRIINEGATDMWKLIDDILFYTEVNSGNIKIHNQSKDFRELLEQLQKKYTTECELKHLQLEWDVDDSIPSMLVFDEDKLKIILTKILDNAIKFTSAGHVHCRFYLQDDANNIDNNISDQANKQLTIHIEDTGIGIPEAQMADIFDAFKQVDIGLTRRFSGLGIGLSICQKLLQQLKGELTVISKPHEGSCFTISLPVTITAQLIQAVHYSTSSTPAPILVVEDNPINQMVLCEVLSDFGFEYVVANNGQEALEVLEHEVVSIILMDLQMPVLDGITATKLIRHTPSAYQNIPIVAVTANIMDCDHDLCINAGMNDYLPKPINFDQLRTCIDKFIYKSSLKYNDKNECHK
ncbi:MAG: response regulator [Pseudomonadales bacterium]|nr:response regulator [Pseudomonadales bacterium]